MESSSFATEGSLDLDNSTFFSNDPVEFPFLWVYFYFETFGYGVCFLTCLFGNTLTLIATGKYTWLQSKTYTTIQTLAVADLAMVLKIALQYFSMFIIVRISDDALQVVMLAISEGAQDFIIINGFYHVILIAVDRFVAVMWPFFHASKITKRVLWCSSFVTMVISASLSIYYQQMYSTTSLYRIMDFAVYFIAAFILLMLHGKITYIAKRHRNQIEAMGTQMENNSGKTAKRPVARATLMMLVVVGLFLLLWLPYIVCTIIKFVSPEEIYLIAYLGGIGVLLGNLNSSVNFLVYAAFNKKLRYAYKLLLTCRKFDINHEVFEGTDFT